MKLKTNTPATFDIDMTPMIDVVFQLITFFMMVTNFEQSQADERVKLPRDMLAKPPEVKLDHELVINFGYDRNAKGQKTDPQPFVFLTGEKLRMAAYEARLQQESRLYKSKGTDPKDVTVVLRVDTDVPTGLAQELIKLAQQAQFEKFALKATQAVD